MRSGFTLSTWVDELMRCFTIFITSELESEMRPSLLAYFVKSAVMGFISL